MIRLFGVESYFTELYVRDNDASQRIILPAKAIESLTAMASTTIRQSGDMIIACMLLFQSQMSGYQVSSGEFVTYQRLLRSLVRDTSQIIYLPNIYRRFAKSMEVYRQYTDIEPEAPLVIEDCRPPPNWPHAGKIEFCDFSLRYREDLDPALDRINLTINPGEKIGIVGRTGAGKSTLVKTLFRLVHGTTSGTIRIDGLDINSMGVGDLRPRLGIIPQESTMFSGSFRRNLDPLREYTVEDMWAALIKSGIAPKVSPPRVRKDGSVDDDEYDEYYEESKAGADEWWAKSGWMMRLLLLLILDWPQKQKFTRHTPLHGLDRIALSSSQSFSDGQQQLFSFCRVLMRKRRVIVLDEATADVDLETDKHMQQLIRNEFSDLTVLTIAHRLETVMNSDRIIVMDQGRIAEFGSPQELIDAGGMFADLIKTNDFGA
ncbi:hypothetical protein LPJ61_006204 [Coemansia biformis]|uniref:ABC transporter domain-containing protein n=1 Tax=Coemansia biformis TaxID=1286918 RepID=A0A9W7XXC5_9FUNG|nr:hypothetical protein LPJ61_006204 [Coemansia biformis]